MTDFSSLDDYVATPRIAGLALSADGTRLFATVAQLAPDGKRYVFSIWQLDPAGQAPAVRLTRSAEGEGGMAPAPDGSLLFVSKRPWAGGKDDDVGEEPALWSLPPVGEPRRLATRPGGIASVAVARDSGGVVVSSPTLPGAVDGDDESTRRNARKDNAVNAMLHDSSPIRYWDHDLGPDELRLFAAAAPEPAGGATETAEPGWVLRDLTPTPGRALDEQHFELLPDGSAVITGWVVQDTPGLIRETVVAIDVATGEQRTLASAPNTSFSGARPSPDGSTIACIRTVEGTYDDPPTVTLWLVPTAGGEGRDLLPGHELWPTDLAWSADGSAIFFTADDNGRAPLFRVDVDGGRLTRVAADGHYTAVTVAPDGGAVFALRDRIEAPPAPVRIDPDATDQTPEPIPAPGGTAVPGRVEEVATEVADGTTVRGWLILPEAAADGAVPLVLWIHGGPLSSWNSWSWRWNPWLMAVRGYAVLLPDPALSTGYGQQMIRRGWGQWGGAPYDDIMALTDVVVARDDIDETRTAAMGGSYGGYMANWVAGHTDRFRCIVTHASLWALDQFAGTTDVPAYWMQEFGDPVERPERYREFSPHLHLSSIHTPMLVIHGDRDYRVPIGEGLRLWWDLQRSGVESKFLYFPDENHWVLKPGDAKVWYAVVYAWLAQHVLGEDWEQPELV
jgi:dipeptidyl aminopeptidase/acylaminoacyl peptidase